MAGSYQHATLPDGRLRSRETFTDMVENLGDAYETVEEMYGMIWHLAARLAGHGPSAGYDDQTIGDRARELVAQAAEHYADAILAASPGVEASP